MPKVRPLNAFCCGCPLPFGCGCVIGVYGLVVAGILFQTLLDAILGLPSLTMGGGKVFQAVNAVLALSGVPFVGSGVWGLAMRAEAPLRLFLGYTMACTLLHVVVLSLVLWSDPCSFMPGGYQGHGDAMMCGLTRIFFVAFFVMFVCVEMYFSFTVWSMCEEIKAAVVGGIDHLLMTADDVKYRQRHGGYGSDKDYMSINLTDSGENPQKLKRSYGTTLPARIPTYEDYVGRMGEHVPQYWGQHAVTEVIGKQRIAGRDLGAVGRQTYNIMNDGGA